MKCKDCANFHGRCHVNPIERKGETPGCKAWESTQLEMGAEARQGKGE